MHVLDADGTANAMLLEACEPGHSLRYRPEQQHDVVIVGMLRQMWRHLDVSHAVRPLAVQMALWKAETLMDRPRWPDVTSSTKG